MSVREREKERERERERERKRERERMCLKHKMMQEANVNTQTGRIKTSQKKLNKIDDNG